MYNNNTNPQRPRKRVTRKVIRRRQITALVVIFVILIIGIILIANACSDKGGSSKNNNSASTTTTTTTSTTAITTTTTTTTTPIVTADPDDPNTITGLTLDKYEVNIEVGGTDMPWVTMTPESSTEKGEKWESSDVTIATVDQYGNITGVAPGTCYVTVTSTNNPIIHAKVEVTVTGDEPGTTEASPIANENKEDSLTYVQGILIANKTYALPEDYNPGLDPETESQFNALSAAAAQEGLNIWLASGFRSYSYQSQIYNNYVDIYGQSTADTFSARPGHSEHQTGLAIDVNSIDDSFAGTPEAIWLENHAHEYGFIIRYPKGKEHITGYKYEPWHLRYLGKDTATTVYNSGLTLEEYLGIDSVYQ